VFVDAGFEPKNARVLKDETGSRGVGFVEFASEAQQKKAMDGMRGKDIDGRVVNIRPAHVQSEESAATTTTTPAAAPKDKSKKPQQPQQQKI
jgi:RNA recognition motif-containing protein